MEAAAVAALRPRARLVPVAHRASQRRPVPPTRATVAVVAGIAPRCADLPAAMAEATAMVAVSSLDEQ